MRVLVTGGAGYIGSISTRSMLDVGHEVVVLDSLVHGHHSAVDPRARFVHGDVGDQACVRDALEGCDAVLHCAGLIEVAESQSQPMEYWEANVARPLVLLKGMRERGIGCLVFSSTAAVYGEPDAIPIPESATTQPVNTYGETKLAFEKVIASATDAYGLRAIRLRYFNVAGAWPDGSLGEAHDPETHIIPRILNSIATQTAEFEVYGSDYDTPDGTCVRDYLHVCDLAQAHRRALEHLVGGGQGGVFNLGSGSGYSNLEVLNACSKAVGSPIEVRFGPRRAGDPARLVASSERARSVLGWAPERADLSTIVADAWRWHSSQG